MMNDNEIYKLFNMSLLNGAYYTVIENLKKGGLMLVPSGLELSTLV